MLQYEFIALGVLALGVIHFLVRYIEFIDWETIYGLAIPKTKKETVVFTLFYATLFGTLKLLIELTVLRDFPEDEKAMVLSITGTAFCGLFTLLLAWTKNILMFKRYYLWIILSGVLGWVSVALGLLPAAFIATRYHRMYGVTGLEPEDEVTYERISDAQGHFVKVDDKATGYFVEQSSRVKLTDVNPATVLGPGKIKEEDEE